MNYSSRIKCTVRDVIVLKIFSLFKKFLCLLCQLFMHSGPFSLNFCFLWWWCANHKTKSFNCSFANKNIHPKNYTYIHEKKNLCSFKLFYSQMNCCCWFEIIKSSLLFLFLFLFFFFWLLSKFKWFWSCLAVWFTLTTLIFIAQH